MNNIPNVSNGSCDGLGCGSTGIYCFCDMYTKMCNEYQRANNKVWDLNTDDCKHWDKSWRFLYHAIIENELNGYKTGEK